MATTSKSQDYLGQILTTCRAVFIAGLTSMLATFSSMMMIASFSLPIPPWVLLAIFGLLAALIYTIAAVLVMSIISRCPPGQALTEIQASLNGDIPPSPECQ